MGERDFHDVNALLRDAASKETMQRHVLLSVFSLIETNDFEMLPQYLCEDAQLHLYGISQFAGSWSGYRAVSEAIAENFDKVTEQSARVEGLLQQGDVIAVRIHETGVFRSTQQRYEARAVLWFQFEELQIKRIDEISTLVALSPQ